MGQRERILSTLGYDPVLLERLSSADRRHLRGVAVAWLFVCCAFGLAAAYAAWLVEPTPWMPIVGGAGMALLLLNLLRVLFAGGGVPVQRTLHATELECTRYAPGWGLPVVLGVLGILFAQPAQVPFSIELEGEIEAHRAALIEQHEAAAAALGVDAAHHRAELELAGFPIERLKLIWRHPAAALRFTTMFVVLILLPPLWLRFAAIHSARAYELERARQRFVAAKGLYEQRRTAVSALLAQWRGSGTGQP